MARIREAVAEELPHLDPEVPEEVVAVRLQEDREEQEEEPVEPEVPVAAARLQAVQAVLFNIENHSIWQKT